MQAFILSDHEPVGRRVREILLGDGQDCPASHVLPLHQAADRLTHTVPGLLVVVLGPDPERALDALQGLATLVPGRILVVGPAGDSRLVLRALRLGAADYVDESELEAELRSALGRLRAGAAVQSEPGHLIAVLAPSGGSGSSTLAANLAIVLAQQHKKALLLDLKLATGDLAALLDLKPTHTLADLCLNASRMDRIMLERSLVGHPSGVQLLAPPRNFSDVQHVTADGVRQTLALGRVLFPYLVVDLDHSYREEQAQVLRQAEVVLLVLRLDFTSLRNARRTMDYLSELGISRERVRIVVNRYGQPKEVPAAKAEEALGVKVSFYVPDDPKTVNRANNSGVPVVLESPTAKVSRSLANLAAGINGKGQRR
jgi:pilus assembly protein CpaE